MWWTQGRWAAPTPSLAGFVCDGDGMRRQRGWAVASSRKRDLGNPVTAQWEPERPPQTTCFLLPRAGRLGAQGALHRESGTCRSFLGSRAVSHWSRGEPNVTGGALGMAVHMANTNLRLLVS